jgi:hypothetical protein
LFVFAIPLSKLSASLGHNKTWFLSDFVFAIPLPKLSASLGHGADETQYCSAGVCILLQHCFSIGFPTLVLVADDLILWSAENMCFANFSLISMSYY